MTNPFYGDIVVSDFNRDGALDLVIARGLCYTTFDLTLAL